MIVAGDQQIVLTFFGMHKGKARLGIQAPQDVAVHRREVWERIQEALDKEEQAA